MSSPADNWETLVAQAQAKLDQVLQQDIAPVAEEILRERIAADIYAAYTPSYYQRRHALERTVISYIENGDTLLTTGAASASKSLVPGYAFENRYPGAFLEMLEVGNMGFWRRSFPRPAVSMAQGVIDSSAELRRAIEAGIQREFGAL
jgi:hypothetical protein